MANRPGTNATQSVLRSILILSAFTHETPILRVSDIAHMLNLTPSTVSRHLNTMLDAGFIEREADSGFYRLGPQILTLAGVFLHSDAIYRNAYPILWNLSLKTGMHCSLGIPRGSDIIHLISVGPEDTIELFTPIGYHHPMFCCAIGRAILANLPQKAAMQILKNRPLKKYTPYSVTEIPKLMQILEQCRAKGYTTMVNELSLGKASIAAPIFGHHRNILGAVSLSGSIPLMAMDTREEELSNLIVDAAEKISAKLGHFPI